MIKSILLTRTKKNNDKIKKILEPFDYICHNCSLLKYENIAFNYEDIANFTNLIITSKHAAEIIRAMPGNKINQHVWVVGEISAKVLVDKGYHIQYCAKTAEELKKQIPEDLYQHTVYLSSNHITTHMPFLITREIFYRVHYKSDLNSEEQKLFKKKLNYILVYSENCAKTLISLLVAYNLLEYQSNNTVITISAKIADVMKKYFNKVLICNSEDEIVKTLTK
ncbi:MAG: uroporphyrinogen-III synthase [Rickettsiaceae bacterium]|nr:uroporphyrinogen-III synthase [Rickettsiaceae bacterium]